MRGTRWQSGVARSGCRFIPAHAGNSLASKRGPFGGSVHPRACGELNFTAFPGFQTIGSSPRMRGTLKPLFQVRVLQRFIPAHAGNSDMSAAHSTISPVHPRACGELYRVRLQSVDLGGSSPRMRGTHQLQRPCHRRTRFIPAHAGNSLDPGDLLPEPPLHPRACGELRVLADREPHVIGSSPRMRGTRSLWQRLGLGSRFIPAHAGNSGSRSSEAIQITVHPRACGELVQLTNPGVASNGSSPRMRGTPRLPRQERQGAAVHPRACGELGIQSLVQALLVGSSPRMRGTRQYRSIPVGSGRFIPAHAGNSGPIQEV